MKCPRCGRHDNDYTRCPECGLHIKKTTVLEGQLVEVVAQWSVKRMAQKITEGCITTRMAINALLVQRGRVFKQYPAAMHKSKALAERYCYAVLDFMDDERRENTIRHRLCHEQRARIWN